MVGAAVAVAAIAVAVVAMAAVAVVAAVAAAVVAVFCTLFSWSAAICLYVFQLYRCRYTACIPVYGGLISSRSHQVRFRGKEMGSPTMMETPSRTGYGYICKGGRM